MASEKEVALYYPYIDIKDAGLVKTAALYWDEIQTIVPNDEIQKGHKIYNTEISIEAEKEHFLKSRVVEPIDEILTQAGTEIINDLERTPQILDKISKITRKPIRPQKRNRPKFSTIHIEKFNPLDLLRLKNILDKSGIIISPKDNYANWIIVPTSFYDMYMSRLASIITTKDRTSPFTNETLWQDAILDRFIDYSQERKTNQAHLAMLSLQTLSINPQVPLIEVLRFRDKYREDLSNYRRYIRKLARQISKGLDSAEKQSLFEEIVKDEIIPILGDIEKKLTTAGTFFMVSNMVIAIAAIGAILLSGGQAWLGNVLQGAATVGLNCYGNVREERCVTEKPVGYLYKAQQQFGGEN